MTFRARSLTMALCRRASRWATVAALVCAAPLPAQAANADTQAAAVEEARALFQQARIALKQGDLAQALAFFQKSYRRHEALGTLLNMADCEDKLGLTASAWEHYQELTAKLPAGDERLPLAKVRMTALEPRVPRLEIRLAPGAPPGTTVTEDNVELKPADLEASLPVDPIAHVIVVTAKGHKEKLYEVTVPEGQRKTLAVEPGEPTAPPARAPIAEAPLTEAPLTEVPLAKAPATGSPARTAGYVLGGVGIAGLGAGAVTGILAITKKNAVKSLCPEPKQCTPEGVAIEGTGKAFAAASTVAFAAGLAALGVGTYLVLSNREKPIPAAAFSPLVLPGGAGLGASGAF